MVYNPLPGLIEEAKILISEKFENPKLESNGYMYFIKSKGYNVGVGGITPLLAWRSALEHCRCM